MNETSAQGGYLRQAWLVILLALLYGGALAGVQTSLGPKIAKNRLDEAYDVVPTLVPGADRARTVNRSVENASGQQQTVYQALDDQGQPAGWVLPARGQGFADVIELLIGLDVPAETITGLYVLDQKETPGLGNLIATASFREQFAGKTADQPIAVRKLDPVSGNEIRVLSGATISSESVADIVNKALTNYREAIGRLPLAPPQAPEQTPPDDLPAD